MFKLTAIAIVLFFTTAINLFAFYISWQRRKTKSGLYFALGMLGVTFWTLSAGLDYAAVPIPLKVFFTKLEYTGYNIAFVFLVFFALSYTGYDDWLEKGPGKIVFSFIAISNIVLAWTNDLHGLLWSGFTRSEFGDNTVIFEHGPGYVWAVISGYLMILTIIVLLWLASRRGSVLARQQARLIFLSSLIPVAGNLIYLLQGQEFKGVDWTSITFSASGLLFLMALYGTRLLDLAPIARDKLISSLSDGMIVLDIQNRIIEINDVAANMINAAPSTSLIGKDLTQVVSMSRPFLEQSPEQEIKTELEVGTTPKRYFDVLLSPLRESRQTIIGRLIIIRDITERKQAEVAIRESEQRLRSFFETAPIAVMIVNAQGGIVFANAQSANLFQYTIDELQHLQVEALIPSQYRGQHPRLRETYQSQPRVRLMGERRLTALRKDGSEFTAEISLSPLQSSEGTLTISVISDITRRMQIEELRESLIHTMVHDLRNPLASILNAYEILTDPTLANIPDDEREFMFEATQNNAKKMLDLVNAILDVHQLENGEMKLHKTKISVYDLVNEALLLQAPSAKQKQIQIHNEIDVNFPMLEADTQLIMRVLQNLVGNAIKFTPNGGRVYLKAGMPNGNFYQLSVQDTGVGIAADVRDRLFQKFATTKKIGHGTGLGLTFCKLVVEAHGGTIGVESEEGKGTNFYFTLPRMM